MIKKILSTFVNCFKIPELKSRILFTLLVLGICRLVAMIPIPGLDGAALQQFLNSLPKDEGGGLLGMYSLFTGGALTRCAIGGLGIMPYITATIIIQLLQTVIPGLSKLSREEGGRTKIVQYGRYLTVALCLGQGFVMSLGFENPQALFNYDGQLVLIDSIWWYRIQTTLMLTTGTLLLMWLGEQITDRGIGNGISLIITIGILARLPNAAQDLVEMFWGTDGVEARFNPFHGAMLIFLLVAVVAGVIAVTQAQRKIPVQYAQRTVGRKVYQGGSSFMPLRVNTAGVMPIIFAQAILMFPETIFRMLGSSLGIPFFEKLAINLMPGTVFYIIVYSGMILFFSYFWVAAMFNEIQISDDLKRNGGYIPGVRPGQSTTNFLHDTMSRITFAGALFLTVIAVIPLIMAQSMEIPFEVASFFGGTSVLIMVGVVLDTMKQMESHLLTRHYDGFMKKGRLKGRNG